MPIVLKTGNIFDSKANVLVCPVNCIGVMGAGLAKEFEKRFPESAKGYKNLCKPAPNNRGNGTDMILGLPYYDKDFSIMYFPTKHHYRDKSEIGWIEAGLQSFKEWLYTTAYIPKSVAFPMLGCGLGGLSKRDVYPVMLKYLQPLDIEVEIWNA